MKFLILLVSVWTPNGIDNTLSVHKTLAECETTAAIIENDYAYVPNNPLIQTECRQYDIRVSDVWNYLSS